MWPQNPFMFGGWGSPTSVPGFGGGTVEMGGSGGITGGLLSRARRRQSPLSPPQEQPLGYTMPMLGGMVGPMGTPAPEPTTSAQGSFIPQSVNPVQAPQQGWGQKIMQGLKGIDAPAWLEMSGRFADAYYNPENTGQAIGGVGTALQGQKDRALQQEELDYMRGERGQQSAERERNRAEYERYIADPARTPEERAAARAMGPQRFAELAAGQVMTAAQKAELEQERLQAQTEGTRWQATFDENRRQFGVSANLDAQRIRQAGMAAERRSQNLRGPDRKLLEDVREAGGRARDLATLGGIFDEANRNTSTGLLAGLQFWDPNVGTMKQASSTMRGYMRPPGSGATSDYEQRLYAQGAPSIDNMGVVNQQMTSNQRRLADIAVARQYFYEDWADQNGSLNGAERAFQTSQEFQSLTADATQSAEASASEAPARRPDAAPDNAGRVWEDEQGVRWKSNGRGWIRQGGTLPAAPSSGPPVRAGGF